MTRAQRIARGFTLIELVIVVAITAILAVFMVFFLATPIEAYFAQSRRAALVDSADHILRSVAADVRTALPSSLRWGAAGSVSALELLSTTGVARYYGTGEKSGLPPAQEALQELSIGSADTAFYTLDQLPSLKCCYLAIDQQTLPGAYALGGIMTPLPPSFTINQLGGTGESSVLIAGAGFDFTGSPPQGVPPKGSPTNRVFLVSGPVSYLCDKGAHTLQRYSGYSVTTVEPMTDAALMMAGATRALIAQNVLDCTINVVPAPASAAFNELLILEITLAQSGETLEVFDEAGPEYVP
ncbi:MAG: PulJ/GspJ family protein [Steroidobacteraceae bacterium]